jgi:hypothetical protein
MNRPTALDPISTTVFTRFQEDDTMTTTTTAQKAKTRRALLVALAALGLALTAATALPAQDAAARPCIFPVDPQENPLVCHLPRAGGLAGGVGGDSRAGGLARGVDPVAPRDGGRLTGGME